MLISSHLRNASKHAQVYRRRRGGAGHVWRRWAPGASAVKMWDNQSSMRDSGTVIVFAGQFRGMRDGWQVCNLGGYVQRALGTARVWSGVVEEQRVYGGA